MSVIAVTTTTIAWIIGIVILLGWVLYALMNIGSARAELGSEIELAANRKPYYDDEILEGRRLTMVQLFSVILLAIIVVALPLYWVLEPSRLAGATDGTQQPVRLLGFAAVRAHRGRWLQLRGLPRRHGRHRRCRRVHRDRPDHRRGASRVLGGAGAEHRRLPLRS